jgi:hypothetical protein
MIQRGTLIGAANNIGMGWVDSREGEKKNHLLLHVLLLALH